MIGHMSRRRPDNLHILDLFKLFELRHDTDRPGLRYRHRPRRPLLVRGSGPLDQGSVDQGQHPSRRPQAFVVGDDEGSFQLAVELQHELEPRARR